MRLFRLIHSDNYSQKEISNDESDDFPRHALVQDFKTPPETERRTENGEQARCSYNYIICRDQFFNPPFMKLLFNVILTHSAKKIKPYLYFNEFFIFFLPSPGNIALKTDYKATKKPKRLPRLFGFC